MDFFPKALGDFPDGDGERSFVFPSAALGTAAPRPFRLDGHGQHDVQKLTAWPILTGFLLPLVELQRVPKSAYLLLAEVAK